MIPNAHPKLPPRIATPETTGWGSKLPGRSKRKEGGAGRSNSILSGYMDMDSRVMGADGKKQICPKWVDVRWLVECVKSEKSGQRGPSGRGRKKHRKSS